MRQHIIINGMNVNGNMGNGSIRAGVAVHGVRCRTSRRDFGKRLSLYQVPVSKHVVVPVSKPQSSASTGSTWLTTSSAPATAWPCAAIEPPAAAWAALVLQRAVSA